MRCSWVLICWGKKYYQLNITKTKWEIELAATHLKLTQELGSKDY